MLMSAEQVERQRIIRQVAADRVKKIFPIADIGLREQTRKDTALIITARKESADNPDAAIAKILTIWEDNNLHTILSQVQAMITLYDITTAANLWTPDTTTKIIGILNKTEDEDERVYLTAALFARFRYEQVNGGQQETFSTIYKQYLDHMKENGNEDYASRIFGSANGINDRLRDRSLRMGFAVSVENIGPAGNYESESRGGSGIPDSVMHLGPSATGNPRLPSWEKINEGVVTGMPDGIHNSELRVPRVMIGVQVENNSIRTGRPDETIPNRRELYYVSLNGIDSLAVILAIRTLREKDISLDSLETSMDNIIDQKLLADDYHILRTAWNERTTSPFDLNAALNDLKSQALWYCLNRNNLRTEQEVMQVVQGIVLQKLSIADKIEFALIEMRNVDSSLVRRKLERYQELDQINAYVQSRSNAPLDKALQQIIWNVIGEDRTVLNKMFVTRFETIKDKSIS